jgi:TetR/AcrR family transcriptional repressor of bet genes
MATPADRTRSHRNRSRRRLPGGRASSARQRLRLINACISALHIHGPSRTTVEKVVAIAGMSPGIVRFYFASKAAMLVASLEYLAAEFEQRVLMPVMQLRAEPVQALTLLVDLYLDPDIASPRKVSVWYSFWGEASSRQEYYDICGKKDERFADLVRELTGRLIRESGAVQLDADGVALGLIGALEILWQDFAFQTEERIDRAAARRRCLSYLRSVFPQQFGAAASATAARGESGLGSGTLPLFNDLWQLAGHECACAGVGDFITAELSGERALIVRAESRAICSFRNQCEQGLHALRMAQRGQFSSVIDCPIHGLAWNLRGEPIAGNAGPGLQALDSRLQNGFIWVRSGRIAGDGIVPLPEIAAGPELASAAAPAELAVAADWTVLAEHWLEFELPEHPSGRLAGLFADAELRIEEPSTRMYWQARVDRRGSGWFARRYATLAAAGGVDRWQRLFLPPNQWLESREDGVTLLQLLPVRAGHCRIRWLEYRVAGNSPRLRAMAYLAHRLRATWLSQDIEAAESRQRAATAVRTASAAVPPTCPAAAAFRAGLARWSRAAVLS